VEDHGVGLAQAKEGRGMGLVSMRERAELVKGTMEFVRQNGGGTLVRFTVPHE
jgi:signal transduction histidine kinase